jgi:Inner membrane protein YgaP-like, transmembrane domain
MYSNVNIHERIIRPIFSILIAVAVLLLPQIPPWVALLSIYPFFTALIGWDPFYAAFYVLRSKQDTHVLAQHVSHGVTG